MWGVAVNEVMFVMGGNDGDNYLLVQGTRSC